MMRRQLLVLCAAVCGTLYGGVALATDISTKALLIKDNANTAKRKVQLKSKDGIILQADGVGTGTAGAVLHVYSATDDFCAVLPGGANWTNTGKQWKFKDPATKNLAKIKDGSLLMKIKSGVTYSLIDNGTQGTVNAQVQFGTGTRFCMRCTGNTKDEAEKFQAKDCVAAACDAEPSACPPVSGPVKLQGALPVTPGRFNYNLTLGLPGADAACNSNFAGTHACEYSELLTAEAAGDLVGLQDTTSATVTSFWVIDLSNNSDISQCNDDAAMPGTPVAGANWQYGTAHTPSRGQRVDLNNLAGTLGAVQPPQQCNFSSRSVGCCL